MANDLRALLNPRSIAILGASSDLSRVNGRTLKYLLEKGYPGKIFPVNPKYREIGALRCYPDVAAIAEPIDLAIIALPARLVSASLSELGRQGTRSAVVFSSGFGETGEAGRALEREVAVAAQMAGIRLCGPNCLGLINAFERVIATFGQFAEGDTPPGPAAFVTQSGAFGTAIAALARRRGIGLGYFINTGNEADIDFVEVMRAVLADPRIRVGAGYVEGLKDGAGLTLLAGEALSAGKPLLLTKVGRSGAGARAAASHTGSLAGADNVFDGVARQHGIVRARNEEQLLDLLEAFMYCPLPQGNGLGIITQSGGAGVLIADCAEELGMKVPVLTDATQRALKAAIPEFGSTGNPVDITGQFIADPGLLRESVRIVLDDPGVDIAIVWLQLMEAYVDALVTIFEEIRATAAKPLIVCWVAAPERALKALRDRGIAVLRGGEPAADAAAALARYAQARHDWLSDASARAAIRLPQLDLLRRAGPVATPATRELLTQGDIATVQTAFAGSADDAIAAANRIGYPVAVKIESPDILHKTEAGGVALGLMDDRSVRQAFESLTSGARRSHPGARIEGVIIQRMATDGVDFVVGLKNDPVFGAVVMAGLGGIHVEILKDVSFRKAPVTVAEAHRMLDEIKGRAILDGARGRPPVNREALAGLIAAASRCGAAIGPRLRELDLNPVVAGPDGAAAVDWLMLLD